VKLVPLKDWMILEVVKPKLSGIIIPDDMQDPTKPSEINLFKVVEKGPDCKHVEIDDIAVTYYNPAIPTTVDGETKFLFKEEFVCGVWREPIIDMQAQKSQV
jgi:hypothetical protein